MVSTSLKLSLIRKLVVVCLICFSQGYKSWHEEEKADKGHHDKERHSNYFDEKDGAKKDHKEEGEYHQEHDEGEKGEKKAAFDENGKHQKGYNTKGQHFVHKKVSFIWGGLICFD